MLKKINLQLFGGGRWDDKDWATYSSTHIDTKRSAAEIYTSKSIVNELDPKGVKIRESCDSPDNPKSSPLIIALDVTGSMDSVVEAIARKGLPNTATEIYNRKPITDPHIMFMGIGDVEAGDRAPLQVTQFEADIRIAEQLQKLYLERGGGGNRYESYMLAWYFAANHTKIDSFEKRGKKGIIFTIGDEEPTPYLYGSDIEKVMGYKPQFEKITAEDLLTQVSRQYDVYHLIIEQGSNFFEDKVVPKWNKLLGQRAIRVSDYTKIGEIIVSTLEVMGGKDKEEVIKSWDGTTSIAVANAINSLTADTVKTDAVVRMK